MTKVTKLISLLILLFFIIIQTSWAIDKPKWLINLEKFAKEEGDSDLLEKVKLFSDPEAIKLQKDWKNFLSFDAPSIIDKAKDKYSDIKPGIVIDGDNYKQFPSLKKLLPESIYRRLEKGAYAQIGRIRVVPTSSYYLYREVLDATKRNLNKPKIGSNNELKNWRGGVPFPFPENGAQVYHDRDRFDLVGDSIYLNPGEFTMFDRKGKKERFERGLLYWMYYKGRTKLSPKPNIPGYDNILEKGSLRMTYPYDLNGFAVVRTKFIENLKKPDDFISYIPALRRIRRLAGTDTMDPIIGTDIAWEDWRGWWQNIITWPTEFKLIGEGIALLPSMPHRSFYKMDERGKFYENWELRPCFIIEAYVKKGGYFYSKRRVWVDKECFIGTYFEMYDAKGNLWKSLLPIKRINPNGEIHWLFADCIDYINKHRTLMRMQSVVNDPNITNDYFELKYLIKIAH
jgi:hypothetical protein